MPITLMAGNRARTLHGLPLRVRRADLFSGLSSQPPENSGITFQGTTMVTKIDKVVYQAYATSTGGRDGATRS